MTSNPNPQSVTDTTARFAYLISQISTSLINASPDEAAEHIEKALAVLGHDDDKDRCYVFLFSDDYAQMSNTHEWVRSGITAHKEDLQQVPADAMPWFFAHMQEAGRVLVDDVHTLPPEAGGFQTELLREKIQSMMAVGMFLEGRLIGFVGCDLVQRQRNWSDDDVRRMQLIADMIANTVARHRAEEKLQQVQVELRAANERLAQLANEDGLTGLSNRRGLDTAMDSELRRMQRNRQLLTVMMVDIDHFKELNDRHGHMIGDAALRGVAQELCHVLQRSGEVLGRFGGDEFLAICPQLTQQEAEQRAVTLMERVKNVNTATPLTVSIGIYTFIPEPTTTPDEVLRAVDKAVYQAKHDGRNRFFALAASSPTTKR
ncbi:sensor domain-containing diguanylate cyclase [Pseudidiomarina insulisalsae]|uniref:diguanylate cyclase n=1 Tax=Pseudidiomarina insulisalsae TaxID=575789 RepID=A0A432YM78_9GAMM|nr:sensor domain-containing diguanylate cyclase [Pseudidiomarina insulisalsae]RUO61945.1 sensor domain-containing diguanylate cyclase [Pseudidiomarina insulisalsae]